MVGGKDWLDLIVVSGVALAFLTLMLVIQGAQHGRSRGEIIRGVGFVWGAVALTLALACLLEDHWGGTVVDVQVAPAPRVVTRSLTATQAGALAGMLAAMLGLYIGAIVTVRKLTQPTEQVTVTGSDEPGEME